MKLRAIMSDIARIKSFYQVCEILKKMSQSTTPAANMNNSSQETTIVIRMTPEKWFFHRRETAVSGGVKIVTELEVRDFFNIYDFEGYNRQDANEIYLCINPQNLTSAIGKYVDQAKAVKIKLIKRPGLRIETEYPTVNMQSAWAIMECSVHLITRASWNEYDFTPEDVHFDVSLNSPNLRMMRSVVDKMKNLHYPTVTLNASSDGVLKVSAGQPTDALEITTTFRNLKLPDTPTRTPHRQPAPAAAAAAAAGTSRAAAGEAANGRAWPAGLIVAGGDARAAVPNNREAVLSVDLPRFAHFLNSVLLAKLQTLKCQFAHNNMIMLSIKMRNIYLRYIIPAYHEPSD